MICNRWYTTRSVDDIQRRALMIYKAEPWWYTRQSLDDIQRRALMIYNGEPLIFYFLCVKNKKPPPNMETENKYTIHSHIHQYAPHITARPRRSLLTDIRHVFTSATREWFSRPRFEKSKPTSPRFSPSCAYSVSGSHPPRLSVTFLRSYCLRHSL